MGRVFLIIGALAGWLVLAVAVLFMLVGISDAQVSNPDSSTEFEISAVLAVIGLALLVPCMIFVSRKREADPFAALAAGSYGTWQGGMPPPSAGRTMPVAGKIALIIGCIAGVLTVAFGLLGLAIGLSDTTSAPADRSSTILGSWMIIEIGVVVLVPCLFVLLRLQSRKPLPAIAPGMGYAGYPSGAGTIAPPGYGSTAVAPSEELARSYVEWFGWCTGSVGGSAIAVHAATMAAMRESAAGNSSGASQAAREAAARIAGAMAGMTDGQAPAKPQKIKVLSRIAAGTLPLLEPGEQVMVSLYGINRESMVAWSLLLGVLGHLIAASRGGLYFVTVTNRRLVVLSGPQLTGKPNSLVFAVPHSAISKSKYSKGLFGAGTFTVFRGPREGTAVQVPRWWTAEAALAQRLLATPIALLPAPSIPSLPY